MIKGKKLSLICLAVGAMLLLCGLLMLNTDTPDMEYIVPVSATSDTSLQATAQILDELLQPISSMIQQYTIASKRQGQGITSQFGEVAATLYAVHEGYLDLRFERLLSGRFISASDIAEKRQVVVLDNQAALQLFSGEDVLGNTLLIDGRQYEIIGLVQGGKKVGEADQYFAFMPFSTASEVSLSMETIECLVSGTDSSSFASIIENVLRTWNPDGSFYRLAKRRLAAVMPIRVCILLVGIMTIRCFLLLLNRVAKGKCHKLKEELQNKYLHQCWLWITKYVALFACGYACLAVSVWLLVRFAIEPLYTFTEWVPEKLLQASSWADRFWSLNADYSAGLQYVSKEVLCINLSSPLILWGTMIVLLAITFLRLKQRRI